MTATLVNSTHIFIRWDPPASPNGIVSYRVEVYETDLLSNDVIMIYSNQNVTELELLIEYSVRAYSLYTINVTSYTSAGSGTAETALIQTAEEGKRKEYSNNYLLCHEVQVSLRSLASRAKGLEAV